MALKRTYQVASPYTRGSKRARTLTSQVNTLKRQVAANKKELKYYDGYIQQIDQVGSLDQSFLNNVYDSNGQLDNPTFVGRKIHLMKLQIRMPVTSTALTAFTIYREKRKGKSVPFGFGPLNLDPEYHTLLRYYENQMNNFELLKIYNISFGKNGRLAEFDEQTTATATGDVVSGDVKITQDNLTEPLLTANNKISFRMWYTDG